MLPLEHDDTTYRLISKDFVRKVDTPLGTMLQVDPAALTLLTQEAMRDISHFLRSSHLQQLRNILDDPEASDNDRFVALDLLKNAAIAAGGVLPMCQDTGTAIIKAKKGQRVFTGSEKATGGDEEAIARGVFNTFQTSYLRYSQLAPVSMYEEVNTGNNLPAEIKISAVDGDEYNFLFIAKGGGSANKSYLFQETKALLNAKTLLPWIFEKMKTLGTAACPPYHLAVVIGHEPFGRSNGGGALATTLLMPEVIGQAQHDGVARLGVAALQRAQLWTHAVTGSPVTATRSIRSAPLMRPGSAWIFAAIVRIRVARSPSASRRFTAPASPASVQS